MQQWFTLNSQQLAAFHKCTLVIVATSSTLLYRTSRACCYEAQWFGLPPSPRCYTCENMHKGMGQCVAEI